MKWPIKAGGSAARSAGVIAALLLVLLFFTFSFWSSSRIPFQGDVVNSDVTEYHFPMRYLLSDSLESGTLPVWNPYMGCGFPQLAEGQSGILYPLNLLLFLSFEPALAFNLSLIISLLLALIFSYLLFRHYGISRPASIFSATAFTFSGFVTAKLKFTYMINCICWIPLAVYGVEKAFSRRNVAFMLLTTLSLAMQVLAGGPQIFVITLSLVLAVFSWRFVSLLRRRQGAGAGTDRRQLTCLIAGVILCILLAAAFAAPQLLPSLKAYPYSDRAIDRPFSWSLGKPMQPRNLVQFFSPYQYGNPARGTYDLEYDLFWENVAYPGLFTLVLALIALLFLSRRNSTAAMWTLIGLLALAISLGDSLPLTEAIWRYVPGFKLFRFWQRYLVVVVLSMTVLAGKGLDFVLSRYRDNRLLYRLMAVLAIAVLLVDLGLFSYNQISTIDTTEVLEGNATADFIQRKLEDENGVFRISILGQRDVWDEALAQSGGWLGDKDILLKYMELLPPDQNVMFGIYEVSQYGDYGLYRFKMLDTLTTYVYLRGSGWEAEMPRSALNLLAMEGTRYLLTPFELENEGVVEIDELATDIRGVSFRLYEIAGSFPRAYITQGYEVLEIDESISLGLLAASMLDDQMVRDRVILEREPVLRYGPEGPGEARITSYGDREVVIEADSPGGGMLVLSDSYYPEWRAFVDGEEREIYRANYAFRGVELEPGKHVVEFKYRPDSLYRGLFILGAGVLLLLLILIYHRKTGFLRLEGRAADKAPPEEIGPEAPSGRG